MNAVLTGLCTFNFRSLFDNSDDDEDAEGFEGFEGDLADYDMEDDEYVPRQVNCNLAPSSAPQNHLNN